jgi:hypothetical protein
LRLPQRVVLFVLKVFSSAKLMMIIIALISYEQFGVYCRMFENWYKKGK